MLKHMLKLSLLYTSHSDFFFVHPGDKEKRDQEKTITKASALQLKSNHCPFTSFISFNFNL